MGRTRTVLAACALLSATGVASAQTMSQLREYYRNIDGVRNDSSLRASESKSTLVSFAEKVVSNLDASKSLLRSLGSKMHPNDEKKSSVESFRDTTYGAADTAYSNMRSWRDRIGGSDYQPTDSDISSFKDIVRGYCDSFDSLGKYMKARLAQLKEQSDIAERLVATNREKQTSYVARKQAFTGNIKNANNAKRGSTALVQDAAEKHQRAIDEEATADERMLAETLRDENSEAAKAAYEAWGRADKAEHERAAELKNAQKIDQDNNQKLAQLLDEYNRLNDEEGELTLNLINAKQALDKYKGWYRRFQEEVRE